MSGKITKSIVLTEMGDVAVSGTHEAVQCHLNFIRWHARGSKPVPKGFGVPDYEKAGPREEVAMSEDRSRAWIARELGDVPYRTMQLTCHDNPQSWAKVLQGRDA